MIIVWCDRWGDAGAEDDIVIKMIKPGRVKLIRTNGRFLREVVKDKSEDKRNLILFFIWGAGKDKKVEKSS